MHNERWSNAHAAYIKIVQPFSTRLFGFRNSANTTPDRDLKPCSIIGQLFGQTRAILLAKGLFSEFVMACCNCLQLTVAYSWNWVSSAAGIRAEECGNRHPEGFICGPVY
jgi:hypothetical protein